MGVEDLLHALESTLQARYAPTVISFDIGNKFISKNANSPRIVWVLDRETILPASANGRNPRPLGTRECHIDANIWANTTNDVETLMNAIVIALQTNIYGPGGYGLESVDWANDKYSERGTFCKFTFNVRVPFVADPWPTVVITAFTDDTTGTVQGDGKLDSGET